MCFDQCFIHIGRMRCGIANTQQTRDQCQAADQPRQPPIAPIRTFAVIGIHILPQQSDLSRALRDQQLCLRNHGGDGPRGLGPACIGNDAEGAELVATFLDAEERTDATGRAGLRQEIEFRFTGKIGVELRSCAARSARHHFGQAVIGLRPQHDIDMRGTAQDFGPFRLGHAAGDRDDGLAAPIGALLFCDLQAAQFGKQLFRRLFPDMAGIEDHHIGRFGCVGAGIAQRRQRTRHTGGVVDVHLAAIGLDEEFFRQIYPPVGSKRRSAINGTIGGTTSGRGRIAGQSAAWVNISIPGPGFVAPSRAGYKIGPFTPDFPGLASIFSPLLPLPPARGHRARCRPGHASGPRWRRPGPGQWLRGNIP